MTATILLVILAGIFLWFYTQSDKFKTKVDKFWVALVVGASAVFGWLLSAWEVMPWGD